MIFDRRVSRRTPGKFRTRVITHGVVPSLHVDYKNSRIKQYHKEGRALRTETTINNTRDFGIGKLLKNLPELRQVGFQANRRLLDAQTVSHDCSIGEDAFEKVVRPIEVAGQRASALQFGDARVQALLSVLVLFSFQLRGFTNQEMRALLAQLLGLDPANYSVGRMTYDLRRLRLHGLTSQLLRFISWASSISAVVLVGGLASGQGPAVRVEVGPNVRVSDAGVPHVEFCIAADPQDPRNLLVTAIHMVSAQEGFAET